MWTFLLDVLIHITSAKYGPPIDYKVSYIGIFIALAVLLLIFLS